MSTSLWKLTANEARFETNGWQGRLELPRLARGLHHLSSHERPLSVSGLLALRHDHGDRQNAMSDAYARGRDLIVKLAESSDWPVRLELHWRLNAPPASEALCVDLQVSAQTLLWDAVPELTIESTLAAKAAEPPAPSLSPLDRAGPLLARLNGEPFTFAQMVHPSDFCGADLAPQSDGMLRVSHVLFREHLEKGVIRRARLRAIFVSPRGDVERIRACHASFTAEEPDLSA
jgi:hypothetical protein